MGWDHCSWSEENLSSKKLYPGFQFQAKSKKWLPRLKVTPESHKLTVTRIQGTNEAAPPYSIASRIPPGWVGALGREESYEHLESREGKGRRNMKEGRNKQEERERSGEEG